MENTTQATQATQAKRVKKCTVAVEKMEKDWNFSFNFTDGNILTYILNPNHLLYADFAQYGFQEKVMGAINSGKTLEEGFEKAKILLDAFNNGRWSTRGEGDTQPTGGYLAKALAALTGQTLETVKTFLAAQTKADVSGLRADPTVAAKILELKQATMPAASNTSALLAALSQTE